MRTLRDGGRRQDGNQRSQAGRIRGAASMVAVLAAVAGAGVTAGGTPSASAAARAGVARSGHPHPPRRLCDVRPHSNHRQPRVPGVYVDGTRYRIEDDRFGSQDPEQCLTVTPHGRPAFRVTTSRAKDRRNVVQAFPYVQYGCYWGWCTPGSALPLKISHIRAATSDWYTKEHAGGVWNAGYDLWLNSRRLARGHANRAELMIWLNSTARHYKVGGPAGTRKVKVAGRWFYLTHWHTGSGTYPGGWAYIQYRLAGRPKHVRNLNVKAVLLDAARRHLVSAAWYLQGILAGNEIWRGGQGLATTWFSASVTAKGHAKPRTAGSPGADSASPGPGGGAPPVPLTGPAGP